MARTSKKGLEYFPMDIDIFNDLKIRKLIKYQGGKSITVYALLLCNIYKNGYYMEWDKELPFICSELTGFEEAYIAEVIKTCLTLGLFSKELFDAKGVLTSKGIQERYNRICNQCRRVCKINDYCLLQDRQTKSTLQTESTNEFYLLSLGQEIESMLKDEAWLNKLQLLHNMEIPLLRKSLDDFRIQCIADGKENGHSSLQDAKQHFNSWLRIINKKTKNDDKNKSNGRNQRRGNVLSIDEKKEYGDSF